MRVILVQRFGFVLGSIKRHIAERDPARAETIIFCTSPGEVLELVADGLPTIVISSQIYDSGIRGTYLARQVKKRNPQAQFYIYSLRPESGSSVDGYIYKWDPSDKPLVDLVCSDLSDATPQSLNAYLMQKADVVGS